MHSFQALVKGVVALGVAVGVAGAVASAVPAHAQECPGNPDALGTSRTLVLEPGTLTQVGLMQYPQSLPLTDKEVVLTFDDGPLPPNSTEILDILAEQCVKVTYFLIGQQATAFPAVVRRIHDEGHTIGTHTEDHPARMKKLPAEKVRWEIEQGIRDVSAALADPKDLAPFFRIPGLSRSAEIDDEAAAHSLVVFSADVVADDWHRRIKPKDIVARAMKRLQERGKGILLLHDIHPATVAALPELLKELKDNGFHVVHVVPGAAGPTDAVAGSPTTEGAAEAASPEATSTEATSPPAAKPTISPQPPKAAAMATAGQILDLPRSHQPRAAGLASHACKHSPSRLCHAVTKSVRHRLPATHRHTPA